MSGLQPTGISHHRTFAKHMQVLYCTSGNSGLKVAEARGEGFDMQVAAKTAALPVLIEGIVDAMVRLRRASP